MGLKILRLYVKGADKVLSAYAKVSNYLKERKSIDIEMNCPAPSMYPCLFTGEGDLINKCPYGEMNTE